MSGSTDPFLLVPAVSGPFQNSKHRTSLLTPLLSCIIHLLLTIKRFGQTEGKKKRMYLEIGVRASMGNQTSVAGYGAKMVIQNHPKVSCKRLCRLGLCCLMQAKTSASNQSHSKGIGLYYFGITGRKKKLLCQERSTTCLVN